MSEGDRTGSYADLSRRVDKLEETVGSLSGAVSRVEVTVEHVRQLSELRFNSLETALKVIDGNLAGFMRRIEGVMTGEIETAQTRQGQKILADYEAFRERMEAHVEESNLIHASAAAKGEGVVLALSTGKAFLLLLIALAGPVITILVAANR